MVPDDDVQIDTAAINALFVLRSQIDAWVLQPAYDDRKGKSSHALLRTLIPANIKSNLGSGSRMGLSMAELAAAVDTRRYLRLGAQGEHHVRYVNFVEVWSRHPPASRMPPSKHKP